MTKEEVRNCYSMKEVLAMYGLYENRSHFINCPFHNEKTASMMIYKDSFHCFGCGATGDIFDFVMKMDNVSFKEAFQSLGGTYEKPSFKSNLAIYRHQKKVEAQKTKEEKLKRKKNLNNMLISIYRKAVDGAEPLSEVWSDNFKALEYQLYVHECLNNREVRSD